MFTQFNEPWVKDPKSRTLFDCTGGVVAAFDSHADAGRAATCVNAMDGIEDPGGFVHEAKGMQDRIEHLERSLALERANLVQALNQIAEHKQATKRSVYR